MNPTGQIEYLIHILLKEMPEYKARAAGFPRETTPRAFFCTLITGILLFLLFYGSL